MKKGQLVKILNRSKFAQYGEFVAVDGDNYVLKIDSSYMAFKRGDCEAVLPYTIGVKFVSGTGYTGYSNNNTQYNYIVDKSLRISVGDIVWIENTTGWAVVVQIDSKPAKATKRMEGAVYRKGAAIK